MLTRQQKTLWAVTANLYKFFDIGVLHEIFEKAAEAAKYLKLK